MLPLWKKGPEPDVNALNQASVGSSKSTAEKTSLICPSVQPTAPPPYDEKTELIAAAAAARHQRVYPDLTAESQKSEEGTEMTPKSEEDDWFNLDQRQEREYTERERELQEHKKQTKQLMTECEEIMKDPLTERTEAELQEAVSIIDNHVQRHTRVANGLTVPKAITNTRNLIRNYLKQKKEEKTQEGPHKNTRYKEKQGSQFNDVSTSLPFMIIGDMCCIQPPKISELAATIKELPDPLQNPTAFVSALQRSTRYHHLGGPDYRYILCQRIPGVTESQLIEEVEELDPKNDQAANTTSFLDKIDLNAVTMCKQKPDESILVFMKRFTHCWTNEACMPEGGNDQIFITTFLNNIHPECSQLLKLTATDNLYDMKIKNFITLVKTKAGADLFPNSTKAKSVKMLLNFDVEGSEESEKMMYAGAPGDVCFYCGIIGHWRRECKSAAHRDGLYKNLEGLIALPS
uniref:CCHC-type domain-containing protein n=1 Tax=Astatotilapia calliptera TaxID=8154 RepID=A0A3P8P3I0_ASTCA